MTDQDQFAAMWAELMQLHVDNAAKLAELRNNAAARFFEESTTLAQSWSDASSYQDVLDANSKFAQTYYAETVELWQQYFELMQSTSEKMRQFAESALASSGLPQFPPPGVPASTDKTSEPALPKVEPEQPSSDTAETRREPPVRLAAVNDHPTPTPHAETSARAADEAAKPRAPAAERPASTEPVAEVYDRDGEYFFRIDAGGEHLLESRSYQDLASARNGAESVLKNGALEARYAPSEADGGHIFELKAGNHRVLWRSQPYATESARDAAMDALMQACRTAKLVNRRS